MQTEERTADDEQYIQSIPTQDGLWQLQCKPEKSISSSKIEKYLQEMIPKSSTVPYGVIFAAPTDLSKKRGMPSLLAPWVHKLGAREPEASISEPTSR